MDSTDGEEKDQASSKSGKNSATPCIASGSKMILANAVADMLWMDVPVLTYPGPAKPSRVASSLSVWQHFSSILGVSGSWLPDERHSACGPGAFSNDCRLECVSMTVAL